MYLLDTNVISELRKPTPHGAVAAWYAEQQFHHLALPSVVVYELPAGANRTRRQDPLNAEELDSWIDSVIQAISVLPFGAIDARLTATFMHKRSIELFPMR